MIDLLPAFLLERAPYLLFVLPVTAGAYFMLAQRNLLLSFVGLYLLQTGVIFFFVLLSVRANATIPILMKRTDTPYANPLPHALMLTAIVVGVALLGVALSMMRRVQLEEGSLQKSGPRKREARNPGRDPR
jgi:multicomponent Na+:H+ antiporter subunit C